MGKCMTCWTKEQLENMLEDVVNELDLSDGMVEKHGQLGTPPAELVRLILDGKDREIAMLKRGFIDATYSGWYCSHCERGVDASEVTYHEQHTVCGRVISNDQPPKTANE
jgi:hypothetical protein